MLMAGSAMSWTSLWPKNIPVGVGSATLCTPPCSEEWSTELIFGNEVTYKSMLNLTPHWQRIRRDHAEAHSVLQRVTEAIYERTEESVRLDGDEVGLSAALDLGLLESADDGITFSDPDVRRDYMIRHTAKLALQAWDDPSTFANFFENAQYRTLDFGSHREVTTVVLLVLAAEHSKDVVGRMGEVARLGAEGEGRNQLFWALYDPFCEALPELDVDPGKLADVLEWVFQATANDGTAGWIYGSVERLAARSRTDAESLYQAFSLRLNSPLVELTANALVALAKFDLPEAHRCALGLTEAHQSALRRVGVAALGRFNYAEREGSDLLVPTWERFEALKGEQNPEIDQALARAYGNMLHQKPEATDALVDLSARSDPIVQIQVASILFMAADKTRDEPWFRSALLNLARVSTSHAGTWQELDHCTARCVEDTPNLVVEFMEAAVVSRDYGSEGREAELPKLLNFTFSRMVQHHPEILRAVVTRWFASSEIRLHRAAADVVHSSYDLLGAEQPWLTLDKQVLDALAEQTVVYVLQRIMGHVVTSRPLAALLLSAVQREPRSPAFLDFVAGALAGYVLYNYPNEAGGYLRSRIESGEASEVEFKLAEAALNHSEAYSKALRDLPRLKELQTPSRRLYLLRLAEHKQQATIMEEANNQSVIMSLATRVPLKYGRGFFMERDGNFTEPSNLSSFSHSVERPRGELIDPIGQTLQRMECQSAGLYEIQSQDQTGEETGS